MLKATLADAFLFFTSVPVAFADISKVNEADLVKAIDSPVLKKAQEEDSPGCMNTRYTFGDKVFDMKLEFKCNQINVAWTGSDDLKYEASKKQVVKLAQRTVVALTNGSGIEVERVLAGVCIRGDHFRMGFR